ncbi:MAG: hypothetical protein OHK0019_26970 [Saprospiraceae bacterium]
MAWKKSRKRRPKKVKLHAGETYNDMLVIVERPRDQALYRIGNHFYLGYFDKPGKKYRLRQLKL